MLRSSNPILSRQDSFTPGQQAYGQQAAGYGPGMVPGQVGDRPEGRMTLDDVITKTAMLMGVLVIAAAAAWLLMPPALMMPVAIITGLGTIAISFLVAARRRVPVPLTFVFAVLEGVLVGMISGIFESVYPGIVAQAVFGTFVAAGLTLAAYKFGNIRVTGKFAKVVGIATVAFVIATLLNFVLSFVGINLGLRSGVTGPVSMLSIIVSGIAVVLAVLNLVLDFDHIERGIAMGAPANESWRAAFGLTVTMVWLYVELLRIISYFRR